jgi:hypothetical protein
MPTLNNVTTATITLYKIEEVSLYQAELISTNGNIFHPYDIHTTLNFRVHLNNEDITNNFSDIEWVKYSHDKDLIIEDIGWGKVYHGKSSIDITRDDIDSKCIIQVNAYMIVHGIRTCVASARITLIDVNELYSHTEPPMDPVDGSLWVNTNYNPPIIYSWNSILNKWIEVGRTTPYVRNLIHNSNFWKLNTEGYLIDNSESLHSIRIEQINDKDWVNLKSKQLTNENISAGICQTTIYPIVKNSDYSFSFLIRRTNNTNYNGDSVFCKIFSLNENEELKVITSESIKFDSDKDVQITIPFQTFNDTEYIRCFIGVQPQKLCDFYITQLSLYNTKKYYPWELAPEDVQLQLDNKLNNDHNSVFNALTREGTMEGIYKRVDENGEEHFYFNASHIQTGSLDGGLINGIGLNIKDDATGESIFHVYKDDNGTHIDLIAQNLLIGNSRETASTINYVNNSMSTAVSTAESYTNGQITEVNKVVETKADNSTVNGIEERVTTLESNTEDKVIIETVTGSEAYVQMQSSINKELNNQLKLINSLQDDVEEIAEEIEDNIKVNIASNKIVSTVRDSSEYKNDLDGKLNVTVHTSHVNDMNKYLENTFKAVNENINKKANSDVVTGIESRVSSLEKSTSASNIVTTVRNSSEYIGDLNSKVNASDFNAYKTNISETFNDVNKQINSKVDSNKVIAAINSSLETERIGKSKIDFESNLNLSTIYTSNDININDFTMFPPTITIDNIVDNIKFDVNGTNLTMQAYNIRNTNYITSFNNDANTYMNTNEMIKLLLYEIQKLKKEIDELKNKGGE